MSQYIEIAFVDAAVPDLPHILSSLRPGVRAFVLNAAEPAPAQMARALAGLRDVAVVHIVAHGRPGELNFAAGALSPSALDDHQDDLSAVGRALAIDGEIRLWACETARGARGAAFTDRLAAITGARIAASTARVGAAAGGGGWQLNAGASGAAPPLTAAGLAGYGGVLTVTDITFTNTTGGQTQSFDGSDLSNAATITGSAGSNELDVQFGIVLDMSGWTFVNWTPSPANDKVRVSGSFGADTVIFGTGSRIGGSDLYWGKPTGGTQIDLIQIGTASGGASVDFTSSVSNTFLQFDGVVFGNTSGTSTATFSSNLFPGVTGSAGTNVVVYAPHAGTSIDLSTASFGNWTNGDDTITIVGSTGVEAIKGSSQDDILSVAAGTVQNGDLYDGGGGTNTLLFTGGTVDLSASQDATHGLHNIAALTFSGAAAATAIFRGSTQFGSGLVSLTATVTGSGQADTLQFTQTGSYDLSGLQFVNWTSGSDTINFIATVGVDHIVGTSQDDTFVFNGPFANAGDTFDGGLGNDTLQTGLVVGNVTPVDYSPVTLANFEGVKFINTTGTKTATFGSSQFGSGKISNALTIAGTTAATNAIVVNMATNGSLDLSGWSFANWTNGTDTLTVNGSTGNETVTAGTATDTILGGAGNDTFIVTATAQMIAGDTFDGGAGNDTLQIGTAGAGTSIKFGGALSDGVNGFLNIEGIAFANTSGTSTATFSSAQFGVGKLSNSLAVTGSAGTNALVVALATPGPLDLSGWTFASWTSGTDTFTVTGAAARFAALTGADIGNMGSHGVTAIQSSSGPLILTVDQYRHLDTLAVTGNARIADSAASIDAMTSSEFGGMAGKNIKLLQSTTTPLILSLDQFDNLNGVLLSSDKSTTLQGSEGSIEGLTSGQLGALAAGNIGHISVAGNVLNLGVDQFSALGSAVLNSGIVLTVNGDVGGPSNDTVTFGRQPFSAADKINGGAGTDTLSLQGNYGALNFNADTISNIEKLKLNGGVAGGDSYIVTENDGNLLAGQNLTVAAPGFTAIDTLVFDGSAETDGTFSFTGPSAGTATFTGGNGADTFTLNGGTDSIRYTSASQSNSTAYDVVNGFDAATDSFVWNHSLTFDGTVTGALKSTTFEGNLTAAFAGVGANHAAILQATAGNLQGQMFLLINDANAGYSPGDLIVRLANTNPAAFSDDNFRTSS